MEYYERGELGTDHTDNPSRGTAFDFENGYGMRRRRGLVGDGRMEFSSSWDRLMLADAVN